MVRIGSIDGHFVRSYRRRRINRTSVSRRSATVVGALVLYPPSMYPSPLYNFSLAFRVRKPLRCERLSTICKRCMLTYDRIHLGLKNVSSFVFFPWHFRLCSRETNLIYDIIAFGSVLWRKEAHFQMQLTHTEHIIHRKWRNNREYRTRAINRAMKTANQLIVNITSVRLLGALHL